MEIINNPRAIEETSMAIIEENLPWLLDLPQGEREIIKRIVHTTGDLTCGKMVRIHPQAVQSGLSAIRAGRAIFTDVNMVRTGLLARRMQEFNMEARCYINHPEVVEEARSKGITRARVAMLKGVRETEGGIIAIGNAPTALFALCDMIKTGEARPALVVGTPVGFVGAAESKDELMKMDVPYISLPGTRGGSTIAAAIVNALLLQA